MKVIRSLLVVMVLAGALIVASPMQASAYQGSAKTHGTKTEKKVSRAVYSCPKCEMAFNSSGKCPGCGASLVKINAKVAYTCSMCHVTSKHAGKCPKCGMAMAKTALTYACEKCQVTSTKAGKCSKCGKALKKEAIKFAKA